MMSESIPKIEKEFVEIPPNFDVLIFFLNWNSRIYLLQVHSLWLASVIHQTDPSFDRLNAFILNDSYFSYNTDSPWCLC